MTTERPDGRGHATLRDQCGVMLRDHPVNSYSAGEGRSPSPIHPNVHGVNPSGHLARFAVRRKWFADITRTVIDFVRRKVSSVFLQVNSKCAHH